MFARFGEKLNRHAGAFMILLALGLGATYAVNLHQEQNRTDCQAEYNLAFATQIKVRSSLSAASDKAQTDLIAGVGSLVAAPPTKDAKELARRGMQYRNLFLDFNKVVDQVEKDRAATPLPEFPNC